MAARNRINLKNGFLVVDRHAINLAWVGEIKLSDESLTLYFVYWQDPGFYTNSEEGFGVLIDDVHPGNGVLVRGVRFTDPEAIDYLKMLLL
jgi:hypothetical protein